MQLIVELATEWLIHFNVWQNPLQYCKVISLQLIKKNKIKKKTKIEDRPLTTPDTVLNIDLNTKKSSGP